MERYAGFGNWLLVVLGVLAGVGLLAVTTAVISAATCWD